MPTAVHGRTPPVRQFRTYKVDCLRAFRRRRKGERLSCQSRGGQRAGCDVHSYSLVGIRGDCDFMLEDLYDLPCSRKCRRNSRDRPGTMTAPYSTCITKRSIYVDKHRTRARKDGVSKSSWKLGTCSSPPSSSPPGTTFRSTRGGDGQHIEIDTSTPPCA
jgi:hypothetical protein